MGQVGRSPAGAPMSQLFAFGGPPSARKGTRSDPGHPHMRNAIPAGRAVTAIRVSHPAVLLRPYTPIPTYLSDRNSSMPSAPPSRPKPDCLTPPNGAAGFDGT